MGSFHFLSFFRRGLWLAALGVLVSCTSTTVDEFRQGETGINSEEAVVVLGRRQASDYETRSEFVECVGDRMARGDNAIRIVPEQEFVDALFPWFEPRTAPLRTSSSNKLISAMRLGSAWLLATVLE